MQVEGHINHLSRKFSWPEFLRKTAAGLAGVLLASAGISWLAANWEQATALQKLAGVQILLVLLVALAWRATGRPEPAAGRDFSTYGILAALASVTVGGLLALVGQIYQTGADPWQLFLFWAVLLLPWLVLVRTIFMGVLCGLLLNLAAALYLDVFGGHFLFNISLDWMTASLLLALMNAALLGLWEWAQPRFDDTWRIGPRALASALAGWLIVAAFAGFDAHSGPVLAALIGLAACALMYGIYTSWRPDPAMACLAVATGYFLVAMLLGSQLESEGGLLVLILVLVVLAGLALRHLSRLIVAARPKSDPSAGNDAEKGAVALDPWYLSLLRLVMGLAAVLVIAFLFVSFELEFEQIWMTGLVVCGTGLLVLRGKGSVVREFGTTLTLAGVFMTGAGLFALEEPDAMLRAAGILLLGVLVYGLAAGGALRFLCALFVLLLLYILTWPGDPDTLPLDLLDPVSAGAELWVYFPAYLRLWWLAVAAVLTLALSHNARSRNFWLPLAWALVCMTQAGAWLTPAATILGMGEVAQQLPGLLLIWVACALLPVLALAALLWREDSVVPGLKLAAPLVLGLASLGWMGAPGVSMALLWLVLGHALRQRGLVVFAVLALLAYLGRFYYQMDASLLQKSLVLGLTGGWMLLSWLVLRAHATNPAQPGARESVDAPGRGFRPAVAWWSGLALVLLFANTGIYQREQILRHGQTVVLALAPVDPRSLMQGDYMALRFAAEQETRQWLAQAPEPLAQSIERQRGGWLALKADAQSGHHVQAVLKDLPPADEVVATTGDGAMALLEFRMRDRGLRIVTDAWFFPEGQAGRYEQARFGEFRVNAKGEGLLVRLLDEQQRPLP